MTDASPDWAELRRKAEAARDDATPYRPFTMTAYRNATEPEHILALLDRAEKAEAAVERLRKICSAAANDYAGILTAMEKATPPSFAEAFKATAKELRESSEFMRLAAEGREDGSIYDDELSKAANANREWRAKAWAAEAEAARLREALRPFANAWIGAWIVENRDQIADTYAIQISVPIGAVDRARALTGGDHG